MLIPFLPQQRERIDILSENIKVRRPGGCEYVIVGRGTEGMQIVAQSDGSSGFTQRSFILLMTKLRLGEEKWLANE